MTQIYADRKREKVSPQNSPAMQQPSAEALRSGAARPTREQMGHRVDLPDAMREKMESAFGADLSAVKLYESQAVADAGANAVTQGANIAFAPGMLDFTSFGGQTLLGHEISHVVSQARGEVTGGGFLNDHALEARADREGAMAAAGQTVAMPTAAMSSVSAAPSAAPMQASKKEKNARQASDITQSFKSWKGLENSLTLDNVATVGPQMEQARAAFMASAMNSSRGARGILNQRLRRGKESLNSNAAGNARAFGIPLEVATAQMYNTKLGASVREDQDLVDWVNYARRGKR